MYNLAVQCFEPTLHHGISNSAPIAELFHVNAYDCLTYCVVSAGKSGVCVSRFLFFQQHPLICRNYAVRLCITSTFSHVKSMLTMVQRMVLVSYSRTDTITIIELDSLVYARVSYVCFLRLFGEINCFSADTCIDNNISAINRIDSTSESSSWSANE